MTNMRSLLHWVTHRVPGVSTHAERPAGHQGGVAPRRSPDHRWNHSAARPPRFLPAWQRRIGAFFGQDPR